MGLPKDYLSISQIRTYLTCSQKYKYHYVDRIPTPKSSALLVGSSFHKVIEEAHMKKMFQEAPPNEEEIRDIYQMYWDSNVDEVTFDEEEEPDQEKERGIQLAAAYLQSEYGKDSRPIAVEKQFDVEIEGIPFLGFIDVVEENGWIRDLKTSRKTPSKDVADQSLQLAGYSYAYRYETGEIEKGLSLDYAVSLKKENKIIRLETEVDDHRMDRFKHTFYHVAMAIDKEIFFRNEGSNCSWCPFKNSCLTK